MESKSLSTSNLELLAGTPRWRAAQVRVCILVAVSSLSKPQPDRMKPASYAFLQSVRVVFSSIIIVSISTLLVTVPCTGETRPPVHALNGQFVRASAPTITAGFGAAPKTMACRCTIRPQPMVRSGPSTPYHPRGANSPITISTRCASTGSRGHGWER